MKKIHVDEILKKREDNLPGPGNYEHKRHISAVDTVKYSMRQKHFDYKGKRDKWMPGPGTYADQSLTGVKPTNSKMQSTFQYAFPRDDRFRPPKSKSPPPNNYDTKQDLN